MHRFVLAAVVAASLFASPGVAQQGVASAVQGAQVALPANTEVRLRMVEGLTTKGSKIAVGTTFPMTLVDDVRLKNFIVIPKGTPAVGEVVWKTGKGAFGKSGKMEIEIRYLDLNGRRIPLSGKYRQEGRGNATATAAVVAGAGVLGGIVTGRSATIPEGRELIAYTTEAIPVILPTTAR